MASNAEACHVEIAGTAAGFEPIAAVESSTVDGGGTLERAFTESADGLYRFILFRVGRNRDTADDLLQQTCVEAARSRRQPVDRDECEAWLRGIARNLVRQHWRRRQCRPDAASIEDPALAVQLAEDLESRPLPAELLMQEERVAQLMLAVTSLPAADQGLIFAYYFDGRPQSDIARELGVTDKSIECRLFRARDRLRTVLRNLERPGA